MDEEQKARRRADEILGAQLETWLNSLSTENERFRIGVLSGRDQKFRYYISRSGKNTGYRSIFVALVTPDGEVYATSGKRVYDVSDGISVFAIARNAKLSHVGKVGDVLDIIKMNHGNRGRYS